MNVRNVIACALIAALAGTVEARSSVTASGLEHTSVGKAQLGAVVGRRLPVRNLGSSGEDGVEIHRNSAYGGSVAIDPQPFFSSNGEIKIKHKGWDGLIYHRSRVASNGDNTFTIDVDYTPMGATGLTIMETDADGNVIATDHVTGGTASRPWVPNFFCKDGSLPHLVYKVIKVCPTCTPVEWFGWACDDNTEYTWGDPHGIIIIPDLPIGVPDHGDGSVIMTARGISGFDIIGDDIGTFGLNSWGLGGATIQEECADPINCTMETRRIRVNNLGSSGQDGVAIAVNPDAQSTFLAREGPGPTWDIKKATKFYDEAGRVMLSATQGIGATGEPQFLLDMHGIGADQFEMTFVGAGGEVLGTTMYSTSTPIGNTPAGPTLIGSCDTSPPQCMWDAVSRSWTFSGCDSGWMCRPSAGSAPIGPVMQIIATPVGGEVSKLARIECNGSNAGGEFTIDAVTQNPYCPSDFDHSGFVDIEDYTAFVHAFEEGTIDADVDHSGFVDIEDFTAFVLAFEAGC